MPDESAIPWHRFSIPSAGIESQHGMSIEVGILKQAHGSFVVAKVENQGTDGIDPHVSRKPEARCVLVGGVGC